MVEDSHVFILLRFCFRISQLVHSRLAHIGACENIEDGEEHDNKMAKRSAITHNIVRDRESKGLASELQLKKMHCWNN